VQKKPAAQGFDVAAAELSVDEPAARQKPVFVHAVHAAAPAALYVPTGQSVEALAPAGQKEPAGHAVPAVRPAVAQYVPAAHAAVVPDVCAAAHA